MFRALAKPASAILAATMVFGFAGRAFAAAPVSDDPTKLSIVGPPPPNSRDVPAPAHLQVGTAQATPAATGSGGHIRASHTVWIVPPSGTRGDLVQSFVSDYSSGCGIITCSIKVSSGNSSALWLGSKPFNASRIGLTDRVWASGTDISVSIGLPPSAGVSVSNDVVSMNSSVARNWRVQHAWSNLRFSTHVAMWGPYESQDDSATFGVETFYDHNS